MGKKAFMEMSFSWIFALVVGAFILFLSVFIAVKLLGTEQAGADVQLSKDIGILLNPLEIGFESGKTTILELPTETRIFSGCNFEIGTFGKQTIKTSEMSFGKWSETEIDVSINNKYIFSEVPVEGENFYVFSKPFEFPFKVADLSIITPKNKEYCFVGASEEVVKEIRDLRLQNVVNVTNTRNCPQESEKVCFTGSCDINVREDYVEKNGKRIEFYGDALMYGAIFSEKNIYDCQVKRLMKRVSILASLYEEKSEIVAQSNCNSNLDLDSLISSSNSFSGDFTQLTLIVEDMKRKNEVANCRLW